MRRFTGRWVTAFALAGVADVLFFKEAVGWTAGLFTILLVAAFWLCHRPLWRRWDVRLVSLLLVGLGVAFINQPNWIVWLLTLNGLVTLAVLRFRPIPPSAFIWLGETMLLWLTGWLRPFLDMHGLTKARKRYPERGRCRLQWLIPAGFAVLFAGLIVAGNPLIQKWLEFVDWDFIVELVHPLRLIFLGFMLWVSWCFLRPLRLMAVKREFAFEIKLSGKSWLDTDILRTSLLVFNLLFLVPTVLDAVYLWNGVRLPDGLTYAEYAHQGAYPLIVTALLAGAFVLIALRPGSATGRDPVTRWLVTLWILQNVFLTASSIMRTLLYVEVYSLTHWRVAALIWMGLVGLGLLLVLGRILFHRSSRWLVNANALALLVVLYGCGFVDFSAMIAWYNVRHSQEVTGQGQSLDLYYANHALGVSAVPALTWYERHADLTPARRDEVHMHLKRLTDNLEARQNDWHAWTWRGHRLQQAIKAMEGRRE